MTTPPQVSDERLADLIRVAEGREEEGRMEGLHQISRELRRDALTALRELQRLRSHPRAGLTGEQIVACDAGIEALTWYSDATNEPDIRDYRLRLAATLRALAKGEE
jgi:hypothetical protein